MAAKKKKPTKKALQELSELGDEIEAHAKEEDEDIETWWGSLTKKEQLQAFYAVTKRLHHGELENEGSFRYVLFTVFGFGPEAYALGMRSGYMELHNSIEHNTRENLKRKLRLAFEVNKIEEK